MKIETESFWSKFTSFIIMTTFVFTLVVPTGVTAAGVVTTASDVMSNLAPSSASDHTITFVTPTGLASGQTITLTFSAGFTGVSSMVSNDFDLAENSGSVCTAGTWTEKAVKGSPTTSEFSAIGSGQVVTILSGGASATLTAGRCIRIKAGLNATDATGSGSPTHQISNGAVGSTDTITIGGTFTDTGIITVEIMDSDQVSFTATVNETITFDLDAYATATTNTETSAPYTVALGTLSSGSASGSNESSINAIWFDLATNAGGGAIVSVTSGNGSLKSASVPTHTIPSASATMAAGTANYGICIKRNDVTTGTFTKVAPFNGATCTTTPTGNTVGAVTTSAQNILTSAGAPIAGARAEIMVDAAISAITPAHTDYADTLTFVATGTF